MRSLNHPITHLHNPHLQQMGFLDDLKNWGQSVIDKNINDPTEKFLSDTIGLTPEEIQKIQAEATKELNKQTQAELNNLIAQVTGSGSGSGATTPSTVSQVQAQITGGLRNFVAQLQAGNPAYIAGAALGGGLILYGLYSTLAGPKTV